MSYISEQKTLYLLDKRLVIRATPTQIRWNTGEGSESAAHPIEGVRDIVVHCDARIDGSVFKKMSEEHITILLVDGRFNVVASVMPPLDGRGQIRHRQYEVLRDTEKRLVIARSIVAAKMENQSMLLEEYGEELAVPEVLASALDESLLGIEGSFARSYFARWPALLKETQFTFEGRRKHPAPDAVNALYDFSISLLSNDILAFCHVTGLDPYLGAYHVPMNYRPSLVADLVEEWRGPIIDKFVLRSLRRNEFSFDDFIEKNGGCYVGAGAWGKCIGKWQKWYAREVRSGNTYRDLTFRNLVENQVRAFVRYCNGDEPEYRPYRAREV